MSAKWQQKSSDNAEVLWQNSDLFSGALTTAAVCARGSGEH